MIHSSGKRRAARNSIKTIRIVLGIVCVLSTRDCQAFSFPKQSSIQKSVLQHGKLRYSPIRTTTYLSLYGKRKEESDEKDKVPALPALGPAGTSSNNCGGDITSEEATLDAPAVTTATVDNETPTNTAQTFVNPKFALQYTCNICETKNRVIVSRQAYREGMVIAVCKGCNNKHWIADNLDPTLSHSNIEEYFESKGQGDAVNRVTEEVYEIERVWGLKEGEITDEKGDAVLE